MLFGADCDFKNEVIREAWENLRTVYCFSNAPGTAGLLGVLKSHSMVAVTLDSDESCSHDLRHELVKVMRNAGAKTVVGIYAKAKAPQPLPGRGFMTRSDLKRMQKTVEKLEANPPTADGLDYFIVVEEEKEG